MRSDIRTTSIPLTVEELQSGGRYELLRQMSFNDIMPFVKEFYWHKRTIVTYFHYAVTLLFLALSVSTVRQPGMTFDGWLSAWGLGFLGFFLLLPVHEAIHGLVYKLLGARDVRYGILWRQGAVYAAAHHFVADRRQFTWVALAPFLIINGVLLAAALVLPEQRPLLLAMLFWHTSGTAGDFALLNYFWLNRGREMYTYDDVDGKISYFYAALPSKESH